MKIIWAVGLAAAVTLFACHRPSEDPRSVVEAWAAEVTRGGSGARFWLRPREADKLFAVRTCRVLSVHPVDENGVDVVARVESSNRAGLPVVADWTFFLSRSGASGWKIEFLAER